MQAFPITWRLHLDTPRRCPDGYYSSGSPNKCLNQSKKVPVKKKKACDLLYYRSFTQPQWALSGVLRSSN